jgi:hypothetical protein
MNKPIFGEVTGWDFSNIRGIIYTSNNNEDIGMDEIQPRYLVHKLQKRSGSQMYNFAGGDDNFNAFSTLNSNNNNNNSNYSGSADMKYNKRNNNRSQLSYESIVNNTIDEKEEEEEEDGDTTSRNKLKKKD